MAFIAKFYNNIEEKYPAAKVDEALETLDKTDYDLVAKYSRCEFDKISNLDKAKKQYEKWKWASTFLSDYREAKLKMINK